jgi:hypothetical protein
MNQKNREADKEKFIVYLRTLIALDFREFVLKL